MDQVASREQCVAQVIASRGFVLSCINYNKARPLCRQPVAFAGKAPDKVKNIHQREERRERCSKISSRGTA